MTRLRHYDNLGTARFVTFCCYHRYQLLTDDCVRRTIIQNLEKMRSEDGIRVYGYVIMPEHVHLVLHPPDETELGKVIGRFKGRVSREVLDWMRMRQSISLKRLEVEKDNRLVSTFWQRRCYDHNCRTTGIVTEKIEYCHKNPVVRGLVTHSGEWRWSSYNYYAGMPDVPMRMDEIA